MSFFWWSAAISRRENGSVVNLSPGNPSVGEPSIGSGSMVKSLVKPAFVDIVAGCSGYMNFLIIYTLHI